MMTVKFVVVALLNSVLAFCRKLSLSKVPNSLNLNYSNPNGWMARPLPQAVSDQDNRQKG